MKRAHLVMLAVALCGALGAIAPGAASAASISGTVTVEGGGPIQGVDVCPRSEPHAFETNCTETGASGGYKLDGLPAHSYSLGFYTHRNNLNYVSERYDNTQSFPGDLLTLGAGQDLTGIDAELEEGGTITGTVRDANSLAPAAGVEACASGVFPNEYFACQPTGSDGTYAINALPGGEYMVWFEGRNSVNYLSQYYDGVESSTTATAVAVTSGATQSGIDAALHPGAQILGRVTEAGTGVPLDDVEVCVYDPLQSPSPEYLGPCDLTDPAGEYAIRSLREADYNVVFSQEPGSEFILDDYFFEQWWKGASSLAGATPLHAAPPQSLTGIDAQLVNMIEMPEPEAIRVTILPTPQTPPKTQTPPRKRCKKGFHRKKVKGKKRCVRKRHGHRRRAHT